MTEKLLKIKLMRKQADTIERYLTAVADEEELLEAFASTKDKHNSIFQALDGLSQMDMARALLIGYKIEPEPLKVGNWVVVTGGKNQNMVGMILQIIVIEKRGPETRITFMNGNTDIWSYLRNTELRRATPEEIQAEQERRKWAGIEEGDVLVATTGRIAIFIRDISDAEEGAIRVKCEGMNMTWQKGRCQLYAKKVGASDE